MIIRNLTKRSIRLILILSATAWSFSSCTNVSARKPAEAGIQAQPNVIVVIADQWNAQSFGYAGNSDVKTPNIDHLAAESVVFNTAVSVTPVCSPARASLMTGQYPTTHGVFYNDRPLANSALTIAEIYAAVGYKTGYIGKWHINGHGNNETMSSSRNSAVPAARRQGFQYWKVREVTHEYNNSYYFDENNQKQFWKGYDAFAQTDSAIQFIKSNKNRPFLLFLSWGPPHDPYGTAPEEFRQLYKDKKLKLRPNIPDSLSAKARKDLRGYYAHCSALDKAMGDLLLALQEQNLKENTILVFTSDHGDMLYSQGKVRKQKPWDESIRIPLIIRYPKLLGTKAKSVSTPVNTPDVLPTLLGLSNQKIPASVQGTDFSAVLAGKRKEDEDAAALIQLPVPFHENNFLSGGKEYRAIRTKRYTYVKDLQGPWLLYDNLKDPYQLKNLVNDVTFASLQSRLEKQLQQKLKQVGDDFLSADEYMRKWNYHYDEKDSVRVKSSR